MCQTLLNRRIVVGVSGGIAAYKAISVVSQLRKKGALVKVIMTKNATHIASPLTFGEISGHAVAVDMWNDVHDWSVEHIALASWAEAFIIVPATANVIGKIANGIADDMLTTTVMATKGKIFICPAMNTNMYTNPHVQRNLKTLSSCGYEILTPACGELACGTTGIGRLPEPEEIVTWIEKHLTSSDVLHGKTILVTAGGTQEAIDPVRYIGNHSSGKMGYAIARAVAKRGAHTILVSAAKHLPIPNDVVFIPVDSAQSMEDEVNRHFDNVDALVMAAAVSDFRLAKVSEHKIKKMDTLTLELVKNRDILKQLGAKKKHQKLIGFAAETEHIIDYAKEKLKQKNLDLIVANDVSLANAGFNVDTNEVTILSSQGKEVQLPNMSKEKVADYITDEIQNLFSKNV